MGCCGKNLRTSTKIAGILGIIQSVIYMGFQLTVLMYHLVTNLHGYYSSNDYEIYAVFSARRIDTAIYGMIVMSIVLNLTWFASSIALLLSNAKSNAKGVLQWVIITAAMTACEMYFTINFTAIAVGDIDNKYFGAFWFFFDLFTLSRGMGLVFGWSVNIPLTVWVHRRYNEIQEQWYARLEMPENNLVHEM